MTTPSFEHFALESCWVAENGSSRLDASFYSQDISEAQVLVANLRKNGIEVKQIGDKEITKEVFWPGRFKRKYANKYMGKPFLTSKEVLMLLPKSHKFILEPPKSVIVERDWLLISRSGTIGRCVISNNLLKKFVLSDDLIRVVAANDSLVGYIYAYLNTWVGQAFLTKTQYGATVKHIEPNHVSRMPLPIPPNADEINERIMKAHRLREKAQQLLLQAEAQIHTELDLPEIDENAVQYENNQKGRLTKSFMLSSADLRLRLDASFNQPVLRLIRKSLEDSESKGKCTLTFLEKCGKIFTPPRFKRAYIKDPTLGIPLLQGYHVPLIRP